MHWANIAVVLVTKSRINNAQTFTYAFHKCRSFLYSLVIIQGIFQNISAPTGNHQVQNSIATMSCTHPPPDTHHRIPRTTQVPSAPNNRQTDCLAYRLRQDKAATIYQAVMSLHEHRANARLSTATN